MNATVYAPIIEAQIEGADMPRSDALPHSSIKHKQLVYSPVARALHWTIAALVLITAPIGFIMTDRGERNIWDATTNNMYSTHKLIGLFILALMVGRWVYRLSHGAPPSEPTLTPAQKGLSHAVHWSLYVLLIAVPIGGFLGISYFPALDIFGVKLPALVSPNEDLAKQIFKIHGFAATVLLGLVVLHIAAALYHGFVKSDGVLARMWPGSKVE
jgi:cytochrome b561